MKKNPSMAIFFISVLSLMSVTVHVSFLVMTLTELKIIIVRLFEVVLCLDSDDSLFILLGGVSFTITAA